jgi:hypothetical protein
MRLIRFTRAGLSALKARVGRPLLNDGGKGCQMKGFGIITRRDGLLSPAGEVMLRAIWATVQMLYGLEGMAGG